jgi:transketolase
LKDCCSEDTIARYKAYGWETYEIDGYDFDQMHDVISHLRLRQQKPAFVLVHTVIGKSAPTKAGSSKAHGSPLGPEEVAATKKALGLPEEEFYIPQAVSAFFEQKMAKDKEREESWNEKLPSH